MIAANAAVGITSSTEYRVQFPTRIVVILCKRMRRCMHGSNAVARPWVTLIAKFNGAHTPGDVDDGNNGDDN